VFGLYKAEFVRQAGPVRTVDDLQLRTLTWVHWFNQTRLHSALGHVPPIEFEPAHYRQITLARQPLPGELALH
jgi:putative transposase